MPKDTKLRWYYVAADYENVHVNETIQDHLWERRVFVFRASRGDVEKTALKIAKQHEYGFKNVEGKRVDVQFRSIESTSELFDQRLVSGAEVYWDWFVKPNPNWHKPKPKRKN